MTKNEKKMAVINDIAGFGRCALSVAMPIISAMGIQCCPVPTAILSSNAAFEHYYINDFTNNLENYINHWKSLKLDFNGILTGFMMSEKQVAIIEDFIHFFKTEHSHIIVDPIMGDNGKLYSATPQEIVTSMQRLMALSDIILPNLTEAFLLLDDCYQNQELSDSKLFDLCQSLEKKGAKNIVLTGVARGHQLINYIYSPNHHPIIVAVDKVGNNRCGTGDVFSAIFSGAIVNGLSLENAVKKASDFISKAMIYTNQLETPFNTGLSFEPFLSQLR